MDAHTRFFYLSIILIFLLAPASAVNLSWTQATEHAAFSPRVFFSVAEFDNKIWVIGGLNQDGSEKSYNDVWYSTDGISWDRATGSAGFTPRYGHTTVVYDERIWVIGGYDKSHNFKNDIWSSKDGKTWEQVTPRAAFRPRLLHTSFVYNDKMWVIGGEIAERPWVYTNDIWYSTDGITWHQATPSAAFTPRIGHASVVADDRMWVFGGVGDAYGKIRFNDSWYSTDGITWVSMKEPADFSKRYYLAAAASEELRWISGGFDGTKSLDDVWVSSDSKSWVLAPSDALFPPRYGHASIIFNNRLWVIGGQNFEGAYFNDVWHTSVIESSLPHSKLIIYKTVEPWSIKQGTDTEVTITYTNAGSALLHDIEIVDTLPEDFTLISGETDLSVPQSLVPNESRILVYTIRAMKPGTFTFPKTSALYAGEDGNYHKGTSNAAVVMVLAPLVPDEGPLGDEPESFFNGLWREMTALFSL